jgi:hypothetical protein
MKKIFTMLIVSASLVSATAYADEVKTRDIKVCYHPIPLTVGIVVGVLTGGVGGLVIGGLVAEGTARVVENGSLECEDKKVK